MRFRGFTLVEIILVTTLIVLLAGLTVFRLYNSMDDMALRTTAQKMLKKGIFDVLLCSLEMREVDGHPFHVYLSQNYPDVLQKTIFLVSGFMDEEFKEFVRTHETHYLIKPFDIPGFEKAINEPTPNPTIAMEFWIESEIKAS